MVERFPKRTADEDRQKGEYRDEAKRQITEARGQQSPAEQLASLRQTQESIHAEIAAKKEEMAHLGAQLERTKELLAPVEDQESKDRIALVEARREFLSIEVAELEHQLERLGGISMNVPPKPTLN